MRRPLAVTLTCLCLLLLGGCQAPGLGGSDGAPDSEPESTATPTPGTTLIDVEGDSERTGTPGDDTLSTTTATGSDPGPAPPDPDSDRLGWEAGYWANESLSLTTDDGLNASEREAVVARAMARVETVRGLEFETSVPVTLTSRAEYRNRSTQEYGDALRTFDNAKFEALFLVGEDRDAIAVQQRTLGESVLGYYSSTADAIVLVTESATPTIAERTLAHELVHALQDQHFGLERGAVTRDGIQGRNGLVEGDAVYTQQRYMDRCGVEWRCLQVSGGAGGGDRHFGISFMQYFPYSDGPGLVAALRERGGWAPVNDAYDNYPEGAREVMRPAEYPEWSPTTVPVPDRSTDDWERVQPSTDRNRPDYATVGPSAIAAALAHTLADDYNESAVVETRDVVNVDGDRIDRNDPYNYDLPATDGWAGGRLYAYTDGSESAYVWRTQWDSAADAREFAAAWEELVQHWGGSAAGGDTWTIESGSPYADAIAIRVDGDTVTVVNAPDETAIEEVHDA